MALLIPQTSPKTRTSTQKATDGQLFSGIWIRWQALNVAERFVCANIILLPLWWIVGLLYYMSFLLLLSVAVYEGWHYKRLRLKKPSLAVITLLIFSSYQIVRLLSVETEPATLFQVGNWWIFPAFWLWYIQSIKVKLRLEVVAWALTVSAIQNLGLWFLSEFILPESFFFPPRLHSLYGIITHKTGDFTFLSPFDLSYYEISTLGIAGLHRFQSFTRHPLHLAIIAGVIGLVSLDIKQHRWSRFLFFASIFLLFVSGSRTTWLLFPAVLIIRYGLLNQKNNRFNQILLAAIAIVSFAFLSLPFLTHSLWEQSIQSVTAINEIRAASTDTRFEVYKLTWQGIQENPIWGHIIPGAAVDKVYVGLESFVLGYLLYINGVVGTAIFAVFWISFVIWLYQTRAERPFTCFSVLIFYTLASTTLESVYRSDFSALLLLVCVAIVKTNSKSNQKVNYYA